MTMSTLVNQVSCKKLKFEQVMKDGKLRKYFASDIKH